MVTQYNDDDLGFLSFYSADIRQIAQVLATTSTLSAASFERAVAAPLVEEFHDRFENQIAQTGQNFADWYVRQFDEQTLQDNYNHVSSNNYPFSQQPSYVDKFNNPIIIDVGPGNIQQQVGCVKTKSGLSRAGWRSLTRRFSEN